MVLAFQPPSWVPKEAMYAIDFSNRRAYNGSIAYGGTLDAARFGALFAGGAGVATANTMFMPDIDGIYHSHPAGAPRITRGRGLWVEKTTTNRLLHCRDLTNVVWVASNVTAAKTSTGADGVANGATRLTATAGSGTATILQTTVVASAQFVTSCLMKRVTGTGNVYITQDNGTTWTNITSSLNTSTYTLVQLPAATLANPISGVKFDTDTDAVDVDFFQTENNDYPTTRILTTTATRSRAGGGADMPTLNTTGTTYNAGQRIIYDTFTTFPMTVFAIYSGHGAANHVIKGGGDSSYTRLRGGANGSTADFGTASTGTIATSANTGNDATSLAASGTGAINKVMAYVDGAGCGICLNGGAIATNTSKVAAPDVDTHAGLGNNGAGTAYLGGYLAFLAFWRGRRPNHELIDYTTAGTFMGW